MSTGAITPAEVLAIGRIRQWTLDRAALRSARTAHIRETAKGRRNESVYDARIVRVMDFERALATLPEAEQAILLATYHDGERHHAAAQLLRCSVRKVGYLLPTARKHLASVLDRLDLL